MKTGYVTTFFSFRHAMMLLIEYVCPDGHRITHRKETIDWQAPWMIWC